MSSSDTFHGVVGRTVGESVPSWPEPVRAPAGAPNIVFIVLDDVGFADLGCYGSDVNTPNIDALAEQGLRYTNFHTTAVCSSSRACLLTGRNHHSVGMAAVANWDMGFPGSRGRVAKSAGTLAEMLRLRGYGTFATGKWHITPLAETTAAGPYDQWPTQRGFDRFYGNFAGDNNWVPTNLVYDNHRVLPPDTPGYHLTEDIVDRSIEFVRDQVSLYPEKPFFLYACFRACHSPYHAPKEVIDRYRGLYDKGWDACRVERLERQKKLGVVPPDTELPPRNPDVSAWDDLDPDERRLCVRIQETYAAMLEHADEHIGRLLAHLDTIGQRDNTLVLLLSDNGATREGGSLGAVNALRWTNAMPPLDVSAQLSAIEDIGGPFSYPVNAKGWSMVGNTPLKRYKSTTHGGGVRDPMIVSWPRRITETGGLRGQFCHLVDIVPTVLELVGIDMPEVINGVQQQPLEGVSFAHTLDSAEAATKKVSQYFEMMGNRGIWHEGWKAVAYHEPGTSFDEDDWELYHLDADVGECRDLASQEPERLASLIDLWWEEAERHHVLPLDDRILERFLVSPPNPVADRSRFVYYPGVYVPAEVMPDLKNVSFSIRADITCDANASGAIASCGDRNLGFVLYALGGLIHFHYNAAGDNFSVVAETPLPAGRAMVETRFVKTGELRGVVELLVDGACVGRGSVDRTIGVTFVHQGISIGSSRGTSVTPAYEPPFAFTGVIDRVEFDIGEDRATVELPRDVHDWVTRAEKF